MAQQARQRPSWKNKTSRKAVKRAKELYLKRFDKGWLKAYYRNIKLNDKIQCVVTNNGSGTTAVNEGSKLPRDKGSLFEILSTVVPGWKDRPEIIQSGGVRPVPCTVATIVNLLP